MPLEQLKTKEEPIDVKPVDKIERKKTALEIIDLQMKEFEAGIRNIENKYRKGEISAGKGESLIDEIIVKIGNYIKELQNSQYYKDREEQVLDLVNKNAMKTLSMFEGEVNKEKLEILKAAGYDIEQDKKDIAEGKIKAGI